MKKILILSLCYLFFTSCSKDSEPAPTTVYAKWTIGDESFKIERNLCDISGWSAGQRSWGDSTLEFTGYMIENEEKDLSFSIEYWANDTVFFNRSQLINDYIFPRTIDYSNYPQFIAAAKCTFKGKSYAGFLDYDPFDLVSNDLKVELEKTDFEFTHDCIDFHRNFIAEGNISGTLANVEDETDRIKIENAEFKMIYLLY